MTEAPLRLNLGAGKQPIHGWVNIDQHDDEVLGINVYGYDIFNLPYKDSTVDEILSSHMIEHIVNVLPLMAELYRVCKPDARATFLCPYGSSDDAWENPTHVRPMFVGSWGFFGQPMYWREDYGYTGDWVVEEVHLRVKEAAFDRAGNDPRALWDDVQWCRNVVSEQVAILRANKPARVADRSLQETKTIVFEMLTPISPWVNEVREVGRLQMGLSVEQPPVDP